MNEGYFDVKDDIVLEDIMLLSPNLIKVFGFLLGFAYRARGARRLSDRPRENRPDPFRQLGGSPRAFGGSGGDHAVSAASPSDATQARSHRARLGAHRRYLRHLNRTLSKLWSFPQASDVATAPYCRR